MDNTPKLGPSELECFWGKCWAHAGSTGVAFAISTTARAALAVVPPLELALKHHHCFKRLTGYTPMNKRSYSGTPDIGNRLLST